MTEAPIQVAACLAGNTFVVTVAGRMDGATAPVVDEKVAALVEGGVSSLVLDITGVSFMASAGLRSILKCSRALAQTGAAFALAGPTGMAAELLSIAGLTDLVWIYDTTEEALASVGSQGASPWQSRSNRS